MKLAINAKFGRFGLSEKAYEKLIELGVPVRKYEEQERDSETGLFKPQPLNEGEVIFDRFATPENERDSIYDSMIRLGGRYWDDWTSKRREHPLLVRVIEELGE